MRKSLYAALLLSTTCLYPTDAHAGFVTGFIGGIISAWAPATGLGLVGAGGVGGFLAGSSIGVGIAGFLGTTLGGALLSAALSVGASYLTSLLRPQPKSASPGERMVNARQPVQDRSKSYGEVRVGGSVYFWQAKGGKRYYGVVFNTGRINRTISRYLDEREVSLDAQGFVTNSQYQSGGRSRVRIAEYVGTMGQASPPLLRNNFPEWTSNHRLAGCAHAVIVAENTNSDDFTTVYPSGREPVYTSVLEGTRCYDPRSNSTVYTKNAALIIADWITDIDGLNREVDWDIVAEEANAADQIVQNREGQNIRKWQLSGTYSFSEARETVRANMGAACDAYFFETTGGKVGFRVGRWIEPSQTIVGDDILSAEIIEGSDGTDVKNAQTIQYTEKDGGYREQESAPYIIDDGQPYEQGTLSVYWAPNHNQAVRIGKRQLLVSRAKYRATLTLKLQGLRLLGQRFFRLTFRDADIDEYFEIDKMTWGQDGLTLEVECHSVNPSDFDFDAATEESAKPQHENIEDDTSVANPTGIVAQATAIPVSGGTGVAILIEWNALSRDSYLNQIRYRVADTGGGTPGDWFEVPVPQGQYYQYTPVLSDGETYNIQVRTRSQTGKPSAWVPAEPLTITAVADTSPPGAVQNLNAVGGAGIVDITWTAPNSSNYAAARIYRNTANDFGTAAAIFVEYGSPNADDEHQDGGLAAGTYYYWLEALNGSGVASSPVATGAVTVT